MEACLDRTFSIKLSGGGRIASEAYRKSLAMADDFTGLEEGVDHYQLLLLVKKVGKLAGFTPRMIQLLDYYFAFTRTGDWQAGSRPIVYQSLARTSLDLGVTERQIQKLEAKLFAVGAISWNDSGNHRRYGQRCASTGRLLWAFGVELTPLAFLKPGLEARLLEKQLHDEAWLETKRDISWRRRQIRALLSELSLEGQGAVEPLDYFERRCDAISLQLRTHLKLDQLRSLLAEHVALHEELLGVVEPSNPEEGDGASDWEPTPKGSSWSAPGFAHYKSTIQPLPEGSSRSDPGLQGSVAAPPEPVREDRERTSAAEHVTIGMAVAAASRRLRAELPPDPGWNDLIEAAYRLRCQLGISQLSWGRACLTMGRSAAAVALLVTDRASLRQEDPVRRPAAYFNAMVDRAEQGRLRLCRSVFGLLERGDQA